MRNLLILPLVMAIFALSSCAAMNCKTCDAAKKAECCGTGDTCCKDGADHKH